MTDTNNLPHGPAGDGEPDWIAPLFARSEPALAGLYPASRARRVTEMILARAERRRLCLRQGLTGLLCGALGALAWLLLTFAPQLLAQADALTGPAGPWREAMSATLLLAAAALCAILTRPRTT